MSDDAWLERRAGAAEAVCWLILAAVVAVTLATVFALV